jgi:hypothetical protein
MQELLISGEAFSLIAGHWIQIPGRTMCLNFTKQNTKKERDMWEKDWSGNFLNGSQSMYISAPLSCHIWPREMNQALYAHMNNTRKIKKKKESEITTPRSHTGPLSKPLLFLDSTVNVLYVSQHKFFNWLKITIILISCMAPLILSLWILIVNWFDCIKFHKPQQYEINFTLYSR